MGERMLLMKGRLLAFRQGVKLLNRLVLQPQNLDSIDLGQEIKKLQREDPGEERGEDVKNVINYVIKKEGESGLAELYKELAKCGYKIPDIEKINAIDWIPSSLPTIVMLTSAKIFNWSEEDIINEGKTVASFSLFLKTFIKYFVSPKRTFEIAAKNWHKHFTFGRMEVADYDSSNKRLVIRLHHFKKHPITCIYLGGFCSKIVSVATGNSDVKIRETKCEFKGDPYHEYVFEW